MMKVTGIFLLALVYYVNAYVIETFGVPTTVLEMETCGYPAILDYGYTTLDPFCYTPTCGYPVLDMPLINYDTSICQRPFSTILDMGIAYPIAGPDYIFRDCELPNLRSACGCSLAVSDYATLPPLPPVIGCPKYLRQITIPPPYL